MKVQPDKAECDALRREFGPSVLYEYLMTREAMARAFGLEALAKFDMITKRLHEIRHAPAPRTDTPAPHA